MPRIEGLTNQQSAFLRAFRRTTAGPPPQRWPTPTVLRRWLTKPAFRRALSEIREAIEFQTRFHLVSASPSAAYALVASPGDDGEPASAAADPADAAAAAAARRAQAADLLRLIERRLNR